MKSESQIEQDHRQRAIMAGWFVEKIMRTGRGGFPDRFYAKGGRVVLIEWKRSDGVLSKQQQLRHRQLRKAGVEVFVVRSIAEANEALQLDNGNRAGTHQNADAL